MEDILNADKHGILPVGITSKTDRFYKVIEMKQGLEGTVEGPRPTGVHFQEGDNTGGAE